jgi:CheY-like chemotaxis protein
MRSPQTRPNPLPAIRVVVRRDYDIPKAILYVEDMAENVRLVERILERRPAITLIPAMLAGVALDPAREHRPDLILLDLHLPDLPGEEVIRRLRADETMRHIPVVVLSADATQRHIDQLLAAGWNIARYSVLGTRYSVRGPRAGTSPTWRRVTTTDAPPGGFIPEG